MPSYMMTLQPYLPMYSESSTAVCDQEILLMSNTVNVHWSIINEIFETEAS